MTLKRREFLKLLLAGAAVAGAPALLEACRGGAPASGPTATPDPLLTEAAETALPGSTPAPVAATGLPAATGAPVAGATTAAPAPASATTPVAGGARPSTVSPAAGAAARRNGVWAWLRMVTVDQVPTSEAAYKAHADLIDAVMPLNGGTLQADGTWAQEDQKLTSAWARDLRGLARAAGQLYMPGVGNDRDGILKVLASASTQEVAAADLVKLATKGRFDSPWDGIYLDLEGVDFTHRSEMSGFLFRISRAVKDAGLLLGVSVGGVTQDASGTLNGDDANDLGVAAEVGDFLDLRCYDYGGPTPKTIAPYWWIEACIQYALKKGVKPGQTTLGLANFSQEWPTSDQGGDSVQITYDQALQLAKQYNAQVQWIESDSSGLVRENVAKLGAGHVAITDDKTYRYGLGLADQYGLLGNTMFAPGMGNEAQWQVVAAWEAARKAR